MMNGPFGRLERVAQVRPQITHLADIPQLAISSIPNLPRPRVFGKRIGLNGTYLNIRVVSLPSSRTVSRTSANVRKLSPVV